MKKRRPYARIASGRLPATVACPNCLHKLEAVTAVVLNGEFNRVGKTGRVSVKGGASRCAYCWALLVYADDEGNLRLMTAEERATYKPEPLLARAMETMRPKQPDFTRKNFN